MESSRGALFALLGVTVAWGASFVVMKEALADCSTMLLLALRFSLATVVLWAAMRPRGALQWRRGAIPAGAFAGFLLYLAYVFQTTGLRYTSASKSAFVTGMFVVLAPFFQWVLDRKHPPATQMAAALVATVGLALLTARPCSWIPTAGDLLTLAGAASFAGHIVALGLYSVRFPIANLALAQLITVTFLCWATVSLWEEPLFRATPELLSAILFTGVVCTALAFVVQTWAQRRLPPNRAALAMSTEPVFATITSRFTYGEALSPLGYTGAAFMLLGILLAEWKPALPRKHQS